MSYTNGLDKPSDYFETILYTGNGSSQNIGGLDFQPDWVWIKSRSLTKDHDLYDSVRGADFPLESNTNVAEQDAGGQGLTSFRSDGFAIGNRSTINSSSATQVSWNWKAGGTGSSNTQGDITSTVSANTTSGFSIVSWTGTGSNATIGHGLGASPELSFIKQRTGTQDWSTQATSLGYSKYLILNGTNAAANTSGALISSVSSTTISVDGNGYVNGSSNTYVGYFFSSIKGYSKIGSYTGNGSTDGTFVYTGFKPAWVMIKRTDSGSSAGWLMFDNKRLGYNGGNSFLEAHVSASESSAERIDILSSGFKNRSTTQVNNASGATYIYMCFAESPFTTSTGIPTTAR